MISQLISRILGKRLGSSIASGKGADILSDLFGSGNVNLQDVLSKFGSAGMKEQVQSWIGNGKNLPISREQVEQALGSDKLKDLAAKFGLAPGQVSGLLAEHLPGHVDRATPDGEWPKG
jgi:uncharacterized protein YidB (DUF937 family)